jgi:ADP-ribose pyrophosphatase
MLNVTPGLIHIYLIINIYVIILHIYWSVFQFSILMKYKIEDQEWVYDGFLRIRKAKVTFQKHEGGLTSMDMECMDRGDAVAILLYDPSKDLLYFIRQFRYPPVGKDEPWMLEIPAGSMDPAEKAEGAARREVMEETGFNPVSLHNALTYYASPGGSSERVFFFYGEVTDEDRKAKGGGREDENEDIQIVTLTTKEALQLLRTNSIPDAKSIIALQWFFANIKS